MLRVRRRRNQYGAKGHVRDRATGAGNDTEITTLVFAGLLAVDATIRRVRHI